ncbi:DNA polymerase I [Candidatus Uhrbacteria bacterium]|nr:DNA polymerase I [Candidatus Uhrbacteria bacterium]
MKKHIFMIFDGHALLHRAWHALPPLTTQKGEMVNAVYGFASIFMKALKEYSPLYVAVTFDKKGPTFRHKEYAEYKAHREKKPDEFHDQLIRVREFLSLLGIPLFEKDGFEADDIIATLCKHLEKERVETMIVTGDRDSLQLIDGSTNVLLFRKGISEADLIDETKVAEMYGGLAPKQLLEYKALRGDPSDNIPGVKGIGEKTAIGLIAAHGSLRGVYEALEKKDPALKPAVATKLEASKSDAFLSHRLAKLSSDVPLDINIERCRVGNYDVAGLLQFIQELEFKTLVSRLKDLPGMEELSIQFQQQQKKADTKDYILCSTNKQYDELLENMRATRLFSLDTETDSTHALEARLLAMSFSFRVGNAYCLVWSRVPDRYKKEIQAILEDTAIHKVGHNIKYDCEVLQSEGIYLGGIVCDTMLAAYILNPGVRDYSLDSLSLTEFGYQKIPITDLIGKGKSQISMFDVPDAQMYEYACEDADFTLRLYTLFRKRLEEYSQTSLFEALEMPLISTLIEMETNGVLIDRALLKKISIELDKEIQSCEKKITTYAGEDFNINSPTQLKKILFENLHLSGPRLRKGKTGLSTAASELEKMRSLHPIIECILQYREFAKLKNTYIDVFPELISKKTGRIHTSYNQTIAATGRLSSSNPNMQNIPQRNTMSKEIRKCFIAEKGYSLLAADYSQIELRIVAALAKDKKMIDVFKRGGDIHTMTAAATHGIEPHEVTPAMRRAAKAINFGIIYGMGPQALAESTGTSYNEAVDFIDRYFLAYPGVRAYLDETIAKARKSKYTETLFGRRRYLPELNSGISHVRNAAERMAVNMPIQGTGADIMKLAMIRVYEYLEKEFGIEKRPLQDKHVRMILQVHDELVLEVKTEIARRVAEEIKKIMESVVHLEAPLVVDVKLGGNWGEMDTVRV